MTPITGPIVSTRLCQQNNEKTTTNIFSPQSPSPETIEDCSQITETQLVPEQTNNFSTQEYCDMLSKLASQAAETIPKLIWPNSTNILELVNHVWEKADFKNCEKCSKTILWSPACECRTWTADGFISSVEWDTGICVSFNTLKTPQIKRWAGEPPSPKQVNLFFSSVLCVVCRVSCVVFFWGNNVSQLCFFLLWLVTEQGNLGLFKFRVLFFFFGIWSKKKGCCCWGQTSEQRLHLLNRAIFFVPCWVLFFAAGISSHLVLGEKTLWHISVSKQKQMFFSPKFQMQEKCTPFFFFFDDWMKFELLQLFCSVKSCLGAEISPYFVLIFLCFASHKFTLVFLEMA